VTESEAKSVRRLLVFLGAMVAFAVVLLIIAKVIVSLSGGTPSVDQTTKAQIQQRIAPIGKDYVAGKSQPPSPKPQKQAAAGSSQHKQLSGKQVVQNTCSTCHGTGALGAPKIGSKKDWKPRFEKGKQTLYHHAENGFKAMPPRGGHPSYTNAEITAAVNYMLKQAGLE